jgi:hypothetical protein
MEPLTASLLLAGGSAAASGIASSLKKSGKVRQFATQKPSQIARSEEAGNRGLQMINNPYEGFGPIAEQANQNFYQNVVPTLSERFTSMGGRGSAALSSPAFASQLGAAGAQHSTGLAALQAQYGQNQQQIGQGLLNFGQQPQFENTYMGGGDTAASGMFGGLSSGLGGAANSGFQGYFQNYFNKLNNGTPTNNTPFGGSSSQPYSNEQIQEQFPSSPMARSQQNNMNQGVQAGMDFFRNPAMPGNAASNYNGSWNIQPQSAKSGVQSLYGPMMNKFMQAGGR